jgi:uncharacterized protein YjbI with pentapeptide repeats
MNQSKLDTLLNNHKLWLSDESKGSQLILIGEDLSNLSFTNQKLGQSKINECNLQNTNFTKSTLVCVDFSHSDFNGATFYDVVIENSNFANGKLTNLKLIRSTIYFSQFQNCDFSNNYILQPIINSSDFNNSNFNNSKILGANFFSCHFVLTKFCNSAIQGINFHKCIFDSSDFDNSDLMRLIFNGCVIKNVKGIDSIKIYGENFIDIDTIINSYNFNNFHFFEQMGVQKEVIRLLSGLPQFGSSYYSCFISYCNQDKKFVKKLRDDLFNNGVKVWYMAEDIKIGDKIRDKIYSEISNHDKLLVVLSNNSIGSSWVEEEVYKALSEEDVKNNIILFPIMLDDILSLSKPWIEKIKNSRYIANFVEWDKEPEKYISSLKKLLQDLKKE